MTDAAIAREAAAAPPAPARPFYWSVRRELWENRSVYHRAAGGRPAWRWSAFLQHASLPAARHRAPSAAGDAEAPADCSPAPYGFVGAAR